MQIKNLLALSGVTLMTASQLAYAGPNDFFGGGVPGSNPTDPAAAAAPMAPPSGDYSEDEKRMQKKYKQSIVHAKDLIAKGEEMVKKGEDKRDSRMMKKGHIFKEIGEKQLAELQNNNPFESTNTTHKEKASNPSQL